MHVKGISPIVAAVLLIAVTMTIAGVLAVFAQNLVNRSLSGSQNEPIATECNFGNFVVDACSYDSAAGRMTFILDNIGTVGITNITAFVIYPDNSLNFTQVNGTLPSGQLRSFSISDVGAGYSSVRFNTQCPNVFEEIACR